MGKFRLVQYGCGPIGCSIARLASTREDIDVVGAIDLLHVGRNLEEVAGIERKLGVSISGDGNAILKKTKPHVVLHATSSRLKDVLPQLEQIIRARCNIISTCEELSYPLRKQPELAGKIDNLAKEHKVSVLGTGVNPGFLMDTWPLLMTGVCQDVRKIRAIRIQDASSRRAPFQMKIGAGKTVEEFDKLVEAGALQHVGLSESIAMIAAGLRWNLDDITETIEPVIAEAEVQSDFVTVKEGQVAGLKQVGRGWRGDREMITLDFQAYIGAEESYDAIYITGIPDMEVVIKGGVHGDIATAAIVVNAIPQVVNARPGLLTMIDIPPIHFYFGTSDDEEK